MFYSYLLSFYILNDVFFYFFRSADATARIWRVRSSTKKTSQAIVLPHKTHGAEGEEVAVLCWDQSGNYLATGALDGVARIWTASGNLKHTMIQHKDPIFSLKWNKEGNYLLSGSADSTAIVWDAASGALKQQFAFHSGFLFLFVIFFHNEVILTFFFCFLFFLASTLDVDWKDNKVFATCSSDHFIYVGEVGTAQSIRKFDAHKHEVNAIKWCPEGRLLASCSDDCSAKVFIFCWNLSSL